MSGPDMPELPPAFFSDPACALRLGEHDRSFTGPDRLAREAAAATLSRDDDALADALRRAWRSGVPKDLLATVLANYSCAHELESDDALAIAVAARFIALAPTYGGFSDLALLGEIASRIAEPMGQALVAAQQDDSPCWCPTCIARAASLN
jgi:hypothetical protein